MYEWSDFIKLFEGVTEEIEATDLALLKLTRALWMLADSLDTLTRYSKQVKGHNEKA